MKIEKILNNNVVITRDDNHKEIIVMGKGLAYGKKPNDDIIEEKITKKFILNSMEYPDRLVEALSSISMECIEICDEIIQYAKNKITEDLDDSLYISLMDHINSSIERHKDGVVFKNKLLWEIKHFYKNEYDVGLYGLYLIKNKFGIDMEDGEAGFIALHIVSSEVSSDIHDIYEITEFIQNITNIVKYYFQCEFNEESLYYYRFTTHLKFFGHRIFMKSSKDNNVESIENNLLDIIKEKYVDPYLCTLKIKQFVEKKYCYYLDSDEVLYLTIHITKLIGNK